MTSTHKSLYEPAGEKIYAWHYTTGQKFIEIVRSGFLSPSSFYIGAHELPVLWFSLNQEYEQTAAKAKLSSKGKLIKCTKEETYRLGGGLVRFGYLFRNLIPWPSLREKANITKSVALQLEAVGYAQGALPSEWCGSLSPIPVSALRVEVWDGASWVCVKEP